MTITMTILAVLLCGFFDRMRGDPRDVISRTFEKVAYGLCVGWLLLGHDNPYALAAFAAFFAIGVSPAWGAVIGAVLYKQKMQGEAWWQAGKLKYSIFPALVVRGLIWAAPCALVGFYDLDALWSIPAITIAFTASPYITIVIDDKYDLKDIWATNEIVRGLMLGVFCAIV